ncbi:FHA domain-containing protein [Streptomyces capparidis]
MPTCPMGHESETGDYCSVCGRLMAAPPRPAPHRPAPHHPGPPHPAGPGGSYPPPESGPEPLGPDPDATAAVELCPRCRTPREDGEAYCEGCRWQFGAGQAAAAPPPPPAPPRMPPPPPPAPVGAPPPAPPAHVPPAHVPPAPVPPAPVPPGPAPSAAPPPWGAAPQPDSVESSYRLQPPAQQPGPPPISRPPLDGAPIPRSAGPASWYVTVTADREYYAAMMARSGPEAQHLFFPPYSPERRFELTGNQLRIGRARHRPGEETPEIDLSRPPEDPGVSHKHALLVVQPDGSWAVIDQESTNGTTLNGAEDSIEPYVPVPLKDGDRVHVGAWTTITVHRDELPRL